MSGEPVTNSDVFLWALYELGGDETFVDVEDVFFRSFEIAPQRLGWRTRPNLPDLKKCSKGMRDAENKSPKLLLKNGPDERLLTTEGQQWIESNFDRLAKSLGHDRVVQAPRSRNSSRLLKVLDRSPLFITWVQDGVLADEKWRFAELLRCSPDSTSSVWRRRLEELQSAAYAADRLELLGFLDALAANRSEWFRSPEGEDNG